MLGTVFFYTALLSTLISIIGSTPLRDRDLDAVLNLLQNRANKARSEEDTSSASSSDDDIHNVVDQMNAKDVIKLIQQVVKDKNREPNQRNKLKNQYYQYEPSKNEKVNYVLEDKLLGQLFQDEKKPMKVIHKRLSPNKLLNPIKDDNRLEQKGGLDEYSKIFVILDPNALQNSGNPNEISTLLSNILSQSSTDEKSRQERNKPRRYKGFMVKDSSRRFRRESKEMYGGGGGGGGGSMGDMGDERPKRPRSEHGGGGGGGTGGRTAIPYIRHRGDIYERDH